MPYIVFGWAWKWLEKENQREDVTPWSGRMSIEGSMDQELALELLEFYWCTVFLEG
jgi:hypothetical protein